MTKETITYTDLNGVRRTEDFYFDLSKPEIVKMQASATGGQHAGLERFVFTASERLAAEQAGYAEHEADQAKYPE